MDPLQALKIKHNTVKRQIKELMYYRKEEFARTEKVANLKNQGAETSDINYHSMLLKETLTMIPDAEKRLQTYVKQLNDFLKVNCQESIQILQKEDEQMDETETVESIEAENPISNTADKITNEMKELVRSTRLMLEELCRDYSYLNFDCSAFDISLPHFEESAEVSI